MKGYSKVIYLVGLLYLLIGKSAIGQSPPLRVIGLRPDSVIGQSPPPKAITLRVPAKLIASKTDQSALNKLHSNTTTTQEIALKVANDCEKPQARVSSSITKAKNSEKAHNDISENSGSFLSGTQERFWWAAEQFDPFGGKLIQNWLTYPQKQQVNLVVNWQLWTLLDYLGRYRFVNQFGTVARKYGYSLNVFNQKEQCLATYQYNNLSNPPKWELNLEKLGQDSLQVKPPKQLTND